MTSMTTSRQAGAPTGAPAPVVSLRHVHVAWEHSLILHGVTADIPAGQAVAITGPNGSGKSTLMRAILGQAPITSGSIELFGADNSRSSQIDWARIGYVPQRISSGGAITSSCLEVVSSGLLGRRRWWTTPSDRRRALEALDSVGLAHRAHDPMSILSGGQQQRVLIARALVRTPDLLIMDEPMAGIDARSRMRLAEIAHSAKESGVTLLLVLHELGELGSVLDRELHIENGHFSYDGAPHLDDQHSPAHRNGHHHPPLHSSSAPLLTHEAFSDHPRGN